MTQKVKYKLTVFKRLISLIFNVIDSFAKVLKNTAPYVIFIPISRDTKLQTIHFPIFYLKNCM